MRGLLFAAVIAAALRGQQASISPATVEGVVKNLKTGETLADVRVTLTPETGGTAKSATTDSDGRFSITAVIPGRYSVTATRTLFFRPRRNSGAATLTLTADQRLRYVQLGLMPAGVISGRILDEGRQPLRSVRVEVLRDEYRDGMRTWTPAGQNTSDDRGEYRLFNLQPGTYYVRATQGAGVTQLGPAYYPGVADSEDATPIQVEAGGEIGAIDFVVRRGSEFWVQFKLGGMRPAGTATFYVQRRNSRISELLPARTEPLAEDTYRITRLNPGAYEVFAQVATPADVRPRVITHTARILVNISNGNLDLGTVGLLPSVVVAGRVTASELLQTGIDPRRLTITLRPIDLPVTFGAAARGGTNLNGVSAVMDDGTFSIGGVAIGRFQITMTGLPPDTYLVSARRGPREVLDSGLFTGDQGSVELIIGGPASVGSVEGVVTNTGGEPIPFSTVVLVPAPERRSNPAAFKAATTDQLGLFTIRAVLPGDYKILAWEDIEAGAYMNADFLKDFENRGETVRVQRGMQSSTGVRVIPGQTLTGHEH